MNYILRTGFSLLIVGLAACLTEAQSVFIPSQRTEQVAADTAEIQVQPFPVSGLTTAFNNSFNLINEIGQKRLTAEMAAALISQTDTLISVIDQFLADSVLQNSRGISVRELDNAEDRADLYMEQMEQLHGSISADAKVFENATAALGLERKRWQLTLDQISQEEIPLPTLERIRRAIIQTDSVWIIMQEDLGRLLLQQDRLSNKRLSLESLQTGIREQKAALGERLFRRDKPNFFSELANLGDPTLIGKHMEELRRSIRTDWQVFRSEFALPLSFMSLLFAIFLVFSIWFKKRLGKEVSIEKFELSEMHLTLVYSPVVTVTFVTALLIRFIFPNLPHTFSALNLTILMIPMLIIVIRLFGSLARSWMVALVVIYILTFIYELVYYPDIYLRIVLLAFSTSGIVLFIWMIIKRPLADRFQNSFMYRSYRVILSIFSVLLLIAIAGNLFGALRLAEFFTLIPIQVAFLAIGFQVATRVADTIVFLMLVSNRFQRLNVIRDEYLIIYKKTVWLLNLLLWVFFAVTVLDIFRIKEQIFAWGRNVLTNGWKIGAVDITPGSILIFVFVIWLSIMLTRILRYILEKDVFERISLARGIPSTIILLMKIVLITGGFFLASAAAGMKLTNLSIVLGAFSVGIGFGLQNIFNNMVSGLILAFERPIKVGDTVQVGDLLGDVKSIGLRSSTVRSLDGAEVIVPNGNLISDIMINWTLSDAFRRMDIQVGVAYGTDPEKVIAIMEEVAKAHKMIRKIPPPEAYFTGFGDSSLDFRLHAWSLMENRLQAESDMNVGINKKLNEAGIEIPFPQRDLHIRSDHTRDGKYPPKD